MVGGTDSFFFRSIVDKLIKERHSIFHIAGKNIAKAAVKNSRIVTYNIDVDDEYVQFVVQSVRPECIIYMGAFDDRFIWREYHRSSSKYVAELTNILVAASDMGVKKFIYLSTINVYGFNNEGLIDEETPLAPSNMKSIIIAQGERLCKEFADNNKLNTIMLRFGTVYGDLQFDAIRNDYVIQKCFNALLDRKLVINNQTFPAIYMSDAAIAVHKAVTLDGDSGAYNVCDDETISDAEICDAILTEYAEYDIELEGDESFIAQDYTIDGTKFKSHYAFFQKTKYKQGIQAVARYVRDNQYRINKHKNQKIQINDEKRDFWFYAKALLAVMRPFFESTVTFLLFWGLDYLLRGTFNLIDVDIMVLYIVTTSITFGKQQALVGVVLVMWYYVLQQHAAGNDYLAVFTGVNFVVRILYIFIIGIMVGHVRDRLHQRLDTSLAETLYIENEYNKLNEINDVTVAVKQELEERLITYTDSLATNFTIIQEIDSLLPVRIYTKALETVCNILKTKSVCIYVKKRYTADFKLDFWTDENSMDMGTSINIESIETLYDVLKTGGIYTNKELVPHLPVMAAPVMIDDRITAIVMVWNVKFEALTMYHINLFSTLMKIIQRANEKSSIYMSHLAAQFRREYPALANDNFCMLTEGEFAEAVEMSSEGMELYNIPYCILSINLDFITLTQALTTLRPLLTGMFYLFEHDNRLEILLCGISSSYAEGFLTRPDMIANPVHKHIQLLAIY